MRKKTQTSIFVKSILRLLKAGIVVLFFACLFACLALYLPLPPDFPPLLFLEFGPRWLPVLGLLPILLLRLPKLAKVGILISAGILGASLIDFRIAGCSGTLAQTSTLRIGTYNVGAGKVAPTDVLLWYRNENLDALVMQEVDQQKQWRTAADKSDMQLVCESGLCLVTRYTASTLKTLDRRPLGGWGYFAALFSLCRDDNCVKLLNLHLDTPRHAIEALIEHQPVARAKRMMRDRALESMLASLLTNDQTAIIAGDFNMTQQSPLYRHYWSSWQNAFAKKGCGFGHTKFTRHLSSRIDHILAGQEYEILSAQVHLGFGGDHRPLTASLQRLTINGNQQR